ncbi:MAG: glycosyltransferase [Lysobacterales bacterium]
MNAALAVLIPERGRPDLLATTLRALEAARREVDAPCAVHILVNGSPASDYRGLHAEFGDHHWHFRPRPLGFHGAIADGLSQIAERWVYLLNSDMRLDPLALQTLLPWRHERVFAIASQILLADPSRRREETGYTVPVSGPDGQLELHDLLPPDDQVRTHLYAGGGASLFQTGLLRQYLQRSRYYAPFYFEDADWSMQAWSEGYQVLFCPRSLATHEHRATIGHYYSASTIDRVVQRNLGHFRWRYGDLFEAPRWHGGKLDRLGAGLRALRAEHRQARRRAADALTRTRLQWLQQQQLRRPLDAGRERPRVLLVSPFRVLPPAHGGARRIVELARASADRIDWLLLQDESPAVEASEPEVFAVVQAVAGRPEHAKEQRWQAHAHPALRQLLVDMIERWQPDIVCLEQAECRELLDAIPPTIRVIWTLHDAGRQLSDGERRALQQAIHHVDALVLTTAEDLGYWRHPRQCCVVNGVRAPLNPPGPSPHDGHLLLVGPLRYRPNLDGLRNFLSSVWPELREDWPELRLRVLGGESALQHWGPSELPAGVELIDGFVDPEPHYAGALLALNPQQQVEGSALKLAEALAHGRLMLSTADGARGYAGLQSLALRRVENVAAMGPALRQILADPDDRRRCEQAGPADIAPWHWSAAVEPLVVLLQDLHHHAQL